jgi:hypothetical protein
MSDSHVAEKQHAALRRLTLGVEVPILPIR